MVIMTSIAQNNENNPSDSSEQMSCQKHAPVSNLLLMVCEPVQYACHGLSIHGQYNNTLPDFVFSFGTKPTQAAKREPSGTI